MRPISRVAAVAACLVVASSSVAFAQKSGGILKMYHRDNPPTLSIHEASTNSTVIPMMPLFNNLVVYDQTKAQNSPQTIVPDLAKSWAWSADGKALTFKLEQGVKWHDGQPFTSKDVVCTFNLLTGKGEDKLRTNPRKTWYSNVDSVTTNGDYEVTVHLGLFADVPLPRAGGADAHQAGRHRPVQVRLVQAERGHQGRAQSRLLEEGQALSRRHRVHHRAQPRHGDPELHIGPVRHRLPVGSDDPDPEGHQDPAAD